MLYPADVLLPKPGADMERWASLACDQFTSEPEYWQEADAFVGTAPSTLRIILPEVYLEDADVAQRTEAIHSTMRRYEGEALQLAVGGYVYIERTQENGSIRQGLVGCVDLEDYSYQPGAQCAIRPSENTVVERIPPRLAVRRGALLESPHILMLIDDAGATVIEPLAAEMVGRAPDYDFPLMLGGGRIRGWYLPAGQWQARITGALAALADEDAFRARYGLPAGAAGFVMAVGDGNHSLASAKALWEELKPGLSPQERETHPARYCLLELENVQSPAIEMEPIHRLVTGLSFEALREEWARYAEAEGIRWQATAGSGGQCFTVVAPGGDHTLWLENPPQPLPAGSFEAFYARLAAARPEAGVDYIHGVASVRQLAEAGGIGVLMPDFDKGDLFRGVALGGVLPKKTFSMGHAREKRYYLECRRIQP